MKINLTDHFIESVDKYLHAVQPQYNGERFEIREREIQAFFLARLIDSGQNVRAEGKYPDSEKRYDLLIQDGKNKTFVEIEWDANWTDGFRKRTFDDLEKLCSEAPVGAHAAFFAVNISNKWSELSFSDEKKVVTDPTHLPLSSQSVKQTALGRYWQQQSERDCKAPLLKCGLTLTYWEYEVAPKHNILVLGCLGKKDKDGWKELHHRARSA